MRASSLGFALAYVRPHIRTPPEPDPETVIEYPTQPSVNKASAWALLASVLVVSSVFVTDVIFLATSL